MSTEHAYGYLPPNPRGPVRLIVHADRGAGSLIQSGATADAYQSVDESLFGYDLDWITERQACLSVPVDNWDALTQGAGTPNLVEVAIPHSDIPYLVRLVPSSISDPSATSPAQLHFADPEAESDGGDLSTIHFRSKVIPPTSSGSHELRCHVLADQEHTGERRSLWVHIGGLNAGPQKADILRSQPFREVWESQAHRNWVIVYLDGRTRLGDCYQANSTIHGPVAKAVVEEIIPWVEREFDCGGDGRRFLAGRSTGGWAAVYLQTKYADFFGGCWAFDPDPLDFSELAHLNIYGDRNAFVTSSGAERPFITDGSGGVKVSYRKATRLESIQGIAGRYELSAMQFGSWMATFGPEAGGEPVPLWDSDSGLIDAGVVDHWSQFDLVNLIKGSTPDTRRVLARRLHINAGTEDEYGLAASTEAFAREFAALEPEASSVVTWAAQMGHRDNAQVDWVEVLAEMNRVRGTFA